MAIHAGNAMHLPKAGECARYWPQSHGVYLWCGEPVVPGSDFCAEHLVAEQASTPAAQVIADDRVDAAKRRTRPAVLRCRDAAGRFTPTPGGAA